MEIADTLAFLIGRWSLRRSFDDHRSGSRGCFEGTAVLAGPIPGQTSAPGVRARYHEAGRLQFGTHAGPASRWLEYARLDGPSVMTYFPDGRPFVELDLHGGAWRSTHRCGDDHHRIVTVVRSPSEVEEHWSVRGPSTDYDAVATFRRATGALATSRSEKGGRR
ncbi:MAG TPA: DUF6314 family protein [Acidimicrobiales bacterium]